MITRIRLGWWILGTLIVAVLVPGLWWGGWYVSQPVVWLEWERRDAPRFAPVPPESVREVRAGRAVAVRCPPPGT